jgi:hypothetical protein
MSQHTFIGLDVHARSVAAGLLDAATGEVRSCSAPARRAELVRAREDAHRPQARPPPAPHAASPPRHGEPDAPLFRGSSATL